MSGEPVRTRARPAVSAPTQTPSAAGAAAAAAGAGATVAATAAASSISSAKPALTRVPTAKLKQPAGTGAGAGAQPPVPVPAPVEHLREIERLIVKLESIRSQIHTSGRAIQAARSTLARSKVEYEERAANQLGQAFQAGTTRLTLRWNQAADVARAVDESLKVAGAFVTRCRSGRGEEGWAPLAEQLESRLDQAKRYMQLADEPFDTADTLDPLRENELEGLRKERAQLSTRVHELEARAQQAEELLAAAQSRNADLSCDASETKSLAAAQAAEIARLEGALAKSAERVEARDRAAAEMRAQLRQHEDLAQEWRDRAHAAELRAEEAERGRLDGEGHMARKERRLLALFGIYGARLTSASNALRSYLHPEAGPVQEAALQEAVAVLRRAAEATPSAAAAGPASSDIPGGGAPNSHDVVADQAASEAAQRLLSCFEQPLVDLERSLEGAVRHVSSEFGRRREEYQTALLAMQTQFRGRERDAAEQHARMLKQERAAALEAGERHRDELSALRAALAEQLRQAEQRATESVAQHARLREEAESEAHRVRLALEAEQSSFRPRLEVAQREAAKAASSLEETQRLLDESRTECERVSVRVRDLERSAARAEEEQRTELEYALYRLRSEKDGDIARAAELHREEVQAIRDELSAERQRHSKERERERRRLETETRTEREALQLRVKELLGDVAVLREECEGLEQRLAAATARRCGECAAMRQRHETEMQELQEACTLEIRRLRQACETRIRNLEEEYGSRIEGLSKDLTAGVRVALEPGFMIKK